MTNLATLLLVAGIAFGAFLVGTAAFGRTPGGDEVVAHQKAEIDRLESLPGDVVVPSHVPVSIRIKDPSMRQVLLSAGRDAVPIAYFIAMLWFVRRLLRSVRDGDPFTGANVRRLRIIGLLLLCLPVGSFIINAFEGALAATSEVGELGNSVGLSTAGPLAGVGVFVLAEVFARGVRLREDVEGTV